jgi:hypothetical protein
LPVLAHMKTIQLPMAGETRKRVAGHRASAVAAASNPNRAALVAGRTEAVGGAAVVVVDERNPSRN